MICDRNPRLLTHSLEDPNLPVYKWIIASLIPLLSTKKERSVISIKETFINIIHTMTGKLRLYKLKLEIRSYLMNKFETYLTIMMKESIAEKIHCSLTISTSLLSLLTDSEIRNKILLDDTYNQKFETAVRKIDVVIQTLIRLNFQMNEMDSIKSHVIITLLYYCTNSDYIESSKLKFFLGIVRDTLYSNHIARFPQTQTTISYVLLKSYLVSTKSDITSVFHASVQLQNIERVRNVLKPRLLKVIDFISWTLNCSNLSINSLSLHGSDFDFEDPVLVSLASEIVSLSSQEDDPSLTFLKSLDLYPIEVRTSINDLLEHIKRKLGLSGVLVTDKFFIAQYLGDIICLQANTYDCSSGLCSKCSNSTLDMKNIDEARSSIDKQDNVILLSDILLKNLISQKADGENVILTMAYLTVLYKLFLHFQPPRLTPQCPAFRYIHERLQSSNREVRLLSARIYPLYFKTINNTNDENSNRIFQLLETLDLKSKQYLAEPIISLWGQLAIVSEGARHHAILFKLIDFLGSSNSHQTAMAFHELEIVATSRNRTPWQLLFPILPQLSLSIAQKLSTRPLMGHKIADFVGVPLSTILQRTTSYTVPYLLTYYKTDIIGEIAKASGRTKLDILLENISKIFAVLFTSVPDLTSTKLRTILTNASPQLSGIENHMTKAETIWEILKFYSVEENNAEKITKSITLMASIAGPGISSKEFIKDFFEKGTLAVAQYFSESIRDSKGHQPHTEKIKAIHAIILLVQIAGTSIVSALPQIFTCLSVALENNLLRESTLKCWRIIIDKLDETHLVTLLDQSIAIVAQKWKIFDIPCKAEANLLIKTLFNKSESFKSKHVCTFYSFAGNNELADIYVKVHNLIQRTKPIFLLTDISRRCTSDNKYVVSQGLIDLERFLNQFQNEFYSLYLTKAIYKPVISSLISGLLDVLYTFKSNDEICIQCSKCLGLVGSLDPAKFEPEEKKDKLIITSAFEDDTEVIAFLVKFINQYLVPAFWSSDHPNKQSFLAYSMQEILKVYGFDKVDIKNLNEGTNEYVIWNKFNEISRSTLTPLVSSKYTASVGSYEALSYPIFSPRKDYIKWLRLFTLDLVKRITEGRAGSIFKICSSLIKGQDVSFCTFLLPYAAVHLIMVEDGEENFNNIRTEIMEVLSTDITQVHHLAADNLRLAYEAIFNLIDYFRKWVFARKKLIKKKTKKPDSAVSKVLKLVDSIPQNLMAKRSSQANSFERSALYLEQCYRSGNIDSIGGDFYNTLKTMYANIGDYDSLDGALKVFSTESLEDKITQLEYSENWSMAQDCLEALGDSETLASSFDPDTKLVKSLFDHDLYDKTLDKFKLMSEKKPVPKDWLDLGLESSILSGKVDSLQKWLRIIESKQNELETGNLINYHIGRAVVSARFKDKVGLDGSLDNAFLMLGSSLGLNRTTSLSKNRPLVVLLHSLSDFKAILSKSSKEFSGLKSLLDLRLKHSGNDFKANWIISSYRRNANLIDGSKDGLIDASDLWLNSSKMARKHNRLDLATLAIMHSISMKSSDTKTDFEYGKILWDKGDHTRALKIVENLRTTAKDSNSALSVRQKASIQLKFTKWLDHLNNSSSSRIIDEYENAIHTDPTWEKPYYSLGKYYNKLLDLKTIAASDHLNPRDFSGEYERKTISFYLKAVHCGTKYLYEALPKVVTVWLDFAENISQIPIEFKDSAKVTILTERNKNLDHIHSEIAKYSERLPKYFWFTVYSQLLSRILHPHKVASQLIISISHLVVLEYPSHGLWSVLAQYKSTQNDRSRKARKILELFSSSTSKDSSVSNATILDSSKKLFVQLIDVSKKVFTKVRTPLSLKDDFGFDHGTTPCKLVVPVKTNFHITLPPSVQAMRNHNPFPNSSSVTIQRFNNRVDVLHSMQKPRRLYLIGSDGLSYSILCKPNDDLRKDAKLMELTTMVDYLLKRDYQSEQRKLHIKTYAVIPLNEHHGIIEWVDNSKTMRDILKGYYSNLNIDLDISGIRKVLDKDCEASEKAQLFESTVLSKYPPVLYLWFIENFPDPSSWYHARSNYTRTTAVMSMVGYMLGLGDRHGENLLFNENDGGLLHVDFDCLFEKGLELAVPERVPFRLTRNMVDAFGTTGIEGKFKKSCEVTLSLLRTNETILMNILESFLHDPILDWSHKRKSRSTPQQALSTIRRKIRGIMDKEGLPMSVQGQTEVLIQQATSLENLCQMYIGWMAFW